MALDAVANLVVLALVSPLVVSADFKYDMMLLAMGFLANEASFANMARLNAGKLTRLCIRAFQ